ncbi:TPA: glycosyltransferase family 2 protein [Photobacterium damselae]
MIVIPMAGLSSRFFKAGYTKPKYMLEAHGMTLFDHAVMSFEKYFISETFLFIVRDVYGTADFVKKSAKELGIKSFNIVILNKETRGQAETVYLGLKNIDVKDNTSITIFNIDTFRPEFKYPDLDELGDGYLEVFKGCGDNWSFVKPESDNSNKVIQTAEKDPISDFCCTGLYYFTKFKDFKLTYEEYSKKPIAEWDKGEIYIAPLYNYLIKNNKNIRYHIIDKSKVVFCGTPDEYLCFLSVY